MDYKKVKTDVTTITRNLKEFENKTGNVYEAVALISKRANQILVEMKHELDSKLEEFATTSDSLDEIFENREQIEIAKFYERLPKPTLISIHEYNENKIYYRNPFQEQEDKPKKEE